MQNIRVGVYGGVVILLKKWKLYVRGYTVGFFRSRDSAERVKIIRVGVYGGVVSESWFGWKSENYTCGGVRWDNVETQKSLKKWKIYGWGGYVRWVCGMVRRGGTVGWYVGWYALKNLSNLIFSRKRHWARIFLTTDSWSVNRHLKREFFFWR